MGGQERRKITLQDLNAFREKLTQELEKTKENLEIELRKSSVWRLALLSSKKKIKEIEKSLGAKIDEKEKLRVIYGVIKKVVEESFGEEFVINFDRFRRLYEEFKRSKGRIIPEEGTEKKRRRTKTNEKERQNGESGKSIRRDIL